MNSHSIYKYISKQNQLIVIGTLCVVVFVFVYFEIISSIVIGWFTFTKSYSILIFTISIYMIWLKKDDLKILNVNPSLFYGISLTILGCFFLWRAALGWPNAESLKKSGTSSRSPGIARPQIRGAPVEGAAASIPGIMCRGIGCRSGTFEAEPMRYSPGVDRAGVDFGRRGCVTARLRQGCGNARSAGTRRGWMR